MINLNSTWTDTAEFCYKRGCRCTGCYIKELLESDSCYMKQTVMYLVTKYGKPPEKDIWLNKKEQSVIDAILKGAKNREQIMKITGMNYTNLQSVIQSLYRIAESDSFEPVAGKDCLPEFIKWVKGIGYYE